MNIYSIYIRDAKTGEYISTYWLYNRISGKKVDLPQEPDSDLYDLYVIYTDIP